MKRDTLLLLIGVVILLLIVGITWWAWWSSPRVTTPGCLSAKNSVIVVYTDRQGLLAEHILLQLSAEWVSRLPSDTKFCIAHEDDIGIHNLPVYPYIVVHGEDVAKHLEELVVEKRLPGGYVPLRADFCAEVDYNTYSYGGRNMPAPRYRRSAELVVVNPISPSILHVKEAQLVSELPALSVKAAARIEKATVVTESPITPPGYTVYPLPLLRGNYNLSEFTPTINHVAGDYYVFKRMGWLLYDLGIVDEVAVKKESVNQSSLLTITRDKRSVTIWIIVGSLSNLCDALQSSITKYILNLYSKGNVGIVIAAYLAKTDTASLKLYRNIALKKLPPLVSLNSLRNYCKNTKNATTDTNLVSNSKKIKVFDLANQLPILMVEYRGSEYYILLKLADADKPTIDSLIRHH